jgi:hypothetical protein
LLGASEEGVTRNGDLPTGLGIAVEASSLVENGAQVAPGSVVPGGVAVSTIHLADAAAHVGSVARL